MTELEPRRSCETHANLHIKIVLHNCTYFYWITDSPRMVSPAKVIRTVMPARRLNSEMRKREHLTESEVEQLIAAANDNR